VAGRDDWNRGVIDEFRANEGRVAAFAHQPLLLLHHRGAKTGTERVNPLAYQALDHGYAIFGSKGGAPTNPDWYHNLVANPEVEIEVGTERRTMRAVVAEGEERDRLYAEQSKRYPQFAKYQEATDRTIPVVILEPA
jgi:deazaflavin-dependent oxidoreductase (nitroreductase family)